MLALIPALFLLTLLLGAFIGSSGRAVDQTRELMTQLIPDYSQVILHEVDLISAPQGRHRRSEPARAVLEHHSPGRRPPHIPGHRLSQTRLKPFLLEKLLDAALSVAFLLGLTAVGVAGRDLHRYGTHQAAAADSRLPRGDRLFRRRNRGRCRPVLHLLETRPRSGHLLAGALAAALLWFALRPAFHLFLTYNPGYGFAFGSFKSLFVVIIWIYMSLVIFLFGAEIAASLGRGDASHIKNLMEGRRNIPAGIVNRHVVRHQQGSVIFQDGDPGTEMFSVLKGSVSIRKGEREIGSYPAKARASAGCRSCSVLPVWPRPSPLEDVELVVLDNENINNLMNEFPEFVVEMLREMAQRLREAKIAE